MRKDVMERYFAAFNSAEIPAMLDCLDENIVHYVNEGAPRVGKRAFESFCVHMNRCYKEHLTDMVLFISEDGTRGAAEFRVSGTYLQSDDGLPKAHGQSYDLPAGSFFSLKEDKITRVVTYYNLAEWIRQVS